MSSSSSYHAAPSNSSSDMWHLLRSISVMFVVPSTLILLAASLTQHWNTKLKLEQCTHITATLTLLFMIFGILFYIISLLLLYVPELLLRCVQYRHDKRAIFFRIFMASGCVCVVLALVLWVTGPCQASQASSLSVGWFSAAVGALVMALLSIFSNAII